MIDFSLLAFLNTYGVFVLFLSVLVYLWFIEKNKKEAMHVFLATFFAAAIIIVLKELYGLPRPFYFSALTPKAGYFTPASFPSLHSAVAFALATTVIFYQKKLGSFLIITALIIGVGRIIANVHYPLDIFLGGLVGFLIAVFFKEMHFPS